MTNIFDTIAEDTESFVPINEIAGIYCKYCGQEGKGYDMPEHIAKHIKEAIPLIPRGKPSDHIKARDHIAELRAIGRRAERR